MHTKKNFFDLVRARSNIIFALESYFKLNNYISIHSPILNSWLIPERHIDVFEVNNQGKKSYLMPSPEANIKTLLAWFAYENTLDKKEATIESNNNLNNASGKFEPFSNLPNVYEITHSFRDSEPQDQIHSKEFMMLEWYTAHSSLAQSMKFCCDLLGQALNEVGADKPDWTGFIDINMVYTLGMEELFAHYANLDLLTLIQCQDIKEALDYANLTDKADQIFGTDISRRYFSKTPYKIRDEKSRLIDNSLWEDLFFYIFVDKIELHIPKDRPVFICNYPARLGSLAGATDRGMTKHPRGQNPQQNDTQVWAQRWELYIQGIEIANCYVEETNPSKILCYMNSQVSLIEDTNQVRKKGINYDNNFLQDPLLMPSYAGVALGLDRLIVCLLDNYINERDLRLVSPLALLQTQKKPWKQN